MFVEVDRPTPTVLSQEYTNLGDQLLQTCESNTSCKNLGYADVKYCLETKRRLTSHITRPKTRSLSIFIRMGDPNRNI